MQNVSFSGHETFVFRYGWLKKGVDAVRPADVVDESADKSQFFASERAMVELGVGKNMVNSIRHWCSAANLIENKIRGHFTPTEIAERLLTTDGYDPYFEDPATLWLVHWQIASNIEQCTTWHWLFNHWHGVEFTKEQIYGEIQKWLERQRAKPAAEKTLSRDIDVCIRTYVHSRRGKAAISEDTLDCPLSELNLVTELEDGKTYQFRRGEQTSLPNEIFLFALSEYWRKNKSAANSLTLETIAYEPSSPGKIFKLDEESVVRRLEEITDSTGGAFRYDETAGVKQVYQSGNFAPLVWLENYYRKQA